MDFLYTLAGGGGEAEERRGLPLSYRLFRERKREKEWAGGDLSRERKKTFFYPGNKRGEMGGGGKVYVLSYLGEKKKKSRSKREKKDPSLLLRQ